MRRNHEHTYDHLRWKNFKATLTPEQKKLHARLNALERTCNQWKWDKLPKEKQIALRKEYREITAKLQELIPVHIDSTFTHTEPSFDVEHKVHARIKGL